MRKHHGNVLRSIAGALAAIATVAWIPWLRADPSVASPVTDPTLPPDYPGWRPFEPDPSGTGRIAHAELLDQAPRPATAEELRADAVLTPERRREISTDTKASIDSVVLWADAWNGEETQRAWTDYTSAIQARVQTDAAAQEVGLTGIGIVGVP
jgi:hypothetical protein